MCSRIASHSGSWYSADPAALRAQLDHFSETAMAAMSPVKVLIVPHAGFAYSGQTAAFAYKSIDPTAYKRIFIFGPCHHRYVDGCALPDPSLINYTTPFGSLALDVDVIRELRSQSEIQFKSFSKGDDEEEHSIEMQLPFVQYTFHSNPDVRIVPVFVGSLIQNEERLYGRIFSRYFDDPATLFITSSDFCHWGHRFRFTPKEFPKNTRPQVYPASSMNGMIEALDRQGMDLISNQDCEGFFKYLQSSGNTICGRNGILILMEVMRHAQTKVRMEFVHYSQSGLLPASVTRDDSSVSYAAAVALTI